MSASASELRAYLDFAQSLAREAGAIARQYSPGETAASDKTDNSPVTIVDERVNQLVIDRIAEKFPDIGILAEEQSLRGGRTDGLLWVCDPLDGTIPFVLGMPISTFCLALVEGGQPVVGVVYDFTRDKLYSAARDLGAFCNDVPLARPSTQPLGIVPVEWWHSAPNDVSRLLQKLQGAKYQTPNFASFGYTCLQVALGKIKGAVYAGDKPWDVAAIFVILRELGLEVTAIDGTQQRYDRPIRGAIVSDGWLQKDFLDA